MTDDPFRVDSDEGREVVLDVAPSLLDSPAAFSVVRRGVGRGRRILRLRLTNSEAAELLDLLEDEIGAWKRERDALLAEFRRTDLHSVRAVDPDEGLDEFDPKRSDYGERLADLADVGRKREREDDR
jgi:hypothetical protein